MNRFLVGDLARVKYIRSNRSDYWYPGAIVEIIKISINTIDHDNSVYDYVVRMFNGVLAYPIDNQLEPLYPPLVIKNVKSVKNTI